MPLLDPERDCWLRQATVVVIPPRSRLDCKGTKRTMCNWLVGDYTLLNRAASLQTSTRFQHRNDRRCIRFAVASTTSGVPLCAMHLHALDHGATHARPVATSPATSPANPPSSQLRRSQKKAQR